MRLVGAAGRVLVAAGVLLLLFVAYELWGTGFREGRSQDRLRAEFQAQVAEAASAVPPATVPKDQDNAGAEAPQEASPNAAEAGEDVAAAEEAGEDVAVAEEAAEDVPPAVGDPIAVLRIPKLGLDKIVVEGTDRDTLRLGPGHDPTTPLPGHPGNSVIAGHRTTYGAPFWDLDKLVPGDLVVISTATGESRYVVAESRVVESDDMRILEPTGDDRLTLFTCTPRFSSARRLVVTALLEREEQPREQAQKVSTPPGAPPTEEATRRLVSAEVPSVEGGVQGPSNRPATGLLRAQGSVRSAFAWVLGTVAGIAVTGLARRRYRRVVVYPVAAPVLAVTVFTTFEQLADLLPAGV